MHPLVRLYLKTAFIFLALGLASGLWVQVELARGSSVSHGMIVAHVHLLLVGFVLMMIIGVALWFFPRSGRDQPVGPWPGLVALGYVLLTTGTVVRSATEFFEAWLAAPAWGYIRLAGATLQVAGIAVGIISLWGRIRGAAISKVETGSGQPRA